MSTQVKRGTKSMAIKKEKGANIDEGQVFDLTKLVAYAEGAVVSRTLVKNEAGSVTLFAFDVDQGLSEHTAPFDALVQVIDGEGEFIIGDRPHKVGEGQIILMPANVPHSVQGSKRFKMMLTMLRK